MLKRPSALRVPSLLAVAALAVAGALAVPQAGAAPVATAPPVAAAPAAASADPPYELVDGVTAPIHSYEDAIRETVWVLADDLDDNGEPDRIAVDIIRPAGLDPDVEVPVIMDASPYYLCCGRGNEGERKRYDADGNPIHFPLFYDNYFVPRGYAIALVDMAGTGRSTGCVDHGGLSDIGSAEAVVRWLNGRARAVDADGDPAAAIWSSGKVGMIGKSYDGTLANGVAATGVDGLETIVPISAISSWYDYNRYQGLPISRGYASWLSGYVAGQRTEPIDCEATFDQLDVDADDASGAYNAFFRERDYRDGRPFDASRVEASVFVMHGMQDTNVKTPNFSRWWAALGEAGVERKLWLTRLGHVDAFDSDRDAWVEELHRWFDLELMGIRNNIDFEPAVDVEVAPNRWVQTDAWPLRTGKPLTLRPRVDGSLDAGRPVAGTSTFVNSPSQSEAQAVAVGSNGSRLLFVSDPLAQEGRLSGSPTIDLDVTTTTPTGQVGVALVDYGTADRVLSTGDGALTLATESCYGDATAEDNGCYRDVVRRIGSTPLQVVARGWARLDGAGPHDVRVELTANDVVVPAGHQLGLVIVSASRQWLSTVDTSSTSTYEVDLRRTWMRVPGVFDFAPGAPEVDLPTRAELGAGTVPRGSQTDRLPY